MHRVPSPPSPPAPAPAAGPAGAPWRTPRRRGRRFDRFIAALLASAVAGYGRNLVNATPFDSRRPGYLAFVGALPLRFQDDSSPARHPAQPAATASSDPKPPLPQPPLPPPAAPVAEVESKPLPTPAPAPAAPPPGPSEPAAKTPPRLQWDSTAPAPRPDDFLPYFQAAGTIERPAGSTFILPPVRSTNELPASSATYTQTPH